MICLLSVSPVPTHDLDPGQDQGDYKMLRSERHRSGPSILYHGFWDCEGWVAIQCRAMSARRHTHTASRLATGARKRARPAARPGWPAIRVCRPTDIIFGALAPSA